MRGPGGAKVVAAFGTIPIRDLGFEPVDVGPLRMARYSEPFTMIIERLAYETEAGPAVAYRFEYFEELSE